MALVGASKGFDKVDTGWGSGDDSQCGREDEIGVESHPKYAGSPFQT